MHLLRAIALLAMLLTTIQSADFSKLHDMCDTTAQRQCPNIPKEVALLQKFLNITMHAQLAVTGVWDRPTKEAVAKFQVAHDLSATGSVDEKTKQWLNRELQKRLATLPAKQTPTTPAPKAVVPPSSAPLAKHESPTPDNATVSFSTLHDICEPTAEEQCPNIPKEIALVQKFLKLTTDDQIEVNGKWDDETKDAIIDFQMVHGLLGTGYVGEATKALFNSELQQEIARIKAKRAERRIAKAKAKEAKKVQKAKKATKKPTKLAKKKKRPSTHKKLAHKKTKKKKRAKKHLAHTPKHHKHYSSYEAFKRSVNLRKSYAVYKDPELLRRAKRARTLLKVDVGEQRVKLFVDGKVALSAPCTTGAKRKFEPNTKIYRDKHTPLGTFKIMEKIATKRSNIFVRIYKNGKKIYHGDRRKYKGSWKGVKVVGAPLFNWMRLTSGGIGLHASDHVKRYPASNGCIRLPKKISRILFSTLKKGSVVKVVN